MKLDRFRSSRVLAVALAAALPAGAALATDLYDSLKRMNPAVHASPSEKQAMSARATTYPSDSRGAQGPYRSDTVTSQPPSMDPSATPPEQPQGSFIPSPPVTEERSP